MEQQKTDRRSWQRVSIDSGAELNVSDANHSARVIDISAGGALLSVKSNVLNEDPMALSILQFGKYDVAVVRQWNDRIAVKFHHDEEDQDTLQEDLDAFCRENDYDY